MTLAMSEILRVMERHVLYLLQQPGKLVVEMVDQRGPVFVQLLGSNPKITVHYHSTVHPPTWLVNPSYSLETWSGSSDPKRLELKAKLKQAVAVAASQKSAKVSFIDYLQENIKAPCQ